MTSAKNQESIERDGLRLLEFAQREERKSSATGKNKRRRRRQRERDENCIFIQREKKREEEKERERAAFAKIYSGQANTSRLRDSGKRAGKIELRHARARKILKIYGAKRMYDVPKGKIKRNAPRGFIGAATKYGWCNLQRDRGDDLIRRIDLLNLVSSE